MPKCSRCGGLFEADELKPVIGAYGLFAVFCRDCFEKELSERVGRGDVRRQCGGLRALDSSPHFDREVRR